MKLKERFSSSSTPPWAKKLQRLSVALAAASATLYAVDPQTLPPWSHELAGYCFIAGVIVGVVAQVFTSKTS